MKSAVIAYSGGVDSTFLLKVAKDVLGDKVIAVSARSETYPVSEYKEAKRTAKAIGARHIIINTQELKNKRFSSNPSDRCYYCKGELFKKLKQIAKRYNICHIVDGVNADDLKDFRPGINAADELGVRHLLNEAGLTKIDIRRLSKQLGLATWSKPAQACLASRFPYGEKITAERLKLVETAEDMLKKFNFKNIRVRLHKDIARVELNKDEATKLLEPNISKKLTQLLKNKGITYITLDLEGYRSGSMNEALKI